MVCRMMFESCYQPYFGFPPSMSPRRIWSGKLLFAAFSGFADPLRIFHLAWYRTKLRFVVYLFFLSNFPSVSWIVGPSKSHTVSNSCSIGQGSAMCWCAPC
jgi:hypothetical protein